MNKYELSRDPHVRLIIAILEKAIEDMVWSKLNMTSPNRVTRNKAYNYYSSVNTFLDSETFKTYTDILNISKSDILKMIEKKYTIEASKKGSV